MGEENNTSDKDRKEIAAYIRSMDPYDHPITIHTQPNSAFKFYDDLLSNKYFEATSIRSDFPNDQREADDLRKHSGEVIRKWPIFGEETASHSVILDLMLMILPMTDSGNRKCGEF